MRLLRTKPLPRLTRRLAALAAGLLLASATLTSAAMAQSKNSGFGLFDNLFGGSAPPQAALPPAPGSAAVQPWSGEDGASGHPLMTAAAIRQAADNFDACVAACSSDLLSMYVLNVN